MSARTFALADILTITTGRLVSPRGVDAIYDVLNFMTGDNLFTHQLPRAMGECAPAILAQHPDLASVKVPDGGWETDAAVWSWALEQVGIYGQERELVPLAAEDHTSIDPLTELAMMAPNTPVITVALPDGDTP